jgi:hypothetical protein
MHKLILLVAATAFLTVAGFAAADTSPTTGSTTTTTTTTSTSTTTTTTPAAATTTPSIQAPGQNRLHAHWFAGSVSSVGDASITIGVLWTGPNDGSLNGQTVTVAVPSNARISEGPRHEPIALASIQQNELVSVRATGDDASSLSARAIHVFCNCHWIGGTISSLGGSSFQVDVKRTGPYDTVLDSTTVTLQVDATTVYLAGPHRRRLAFSDLKVGEDVGVVFAADGFFKAPGFDPTKATFTAKRVHVWGHRQVPPPSTDAASAAGTAT